MTGPTEARRLDALHEYGILDTPAEEAFDRLTALASDLFNAPIALVSLIDKDRQWFKSHRGLETCSTPRAWALCDHALARGANAVMVVEDASRDPRFSKNPLVTGAPMIRFYAGAVLTTKEGFNLGTLCVIDTQPRPRPTEVELARLQSLAKIVVDELELGRLNRNTLQKQNLLELAESMSGVGHWRYALGAGTVTWSDEVYKIHGETRETFVPYLEDMIGFYHPDDRPKVSAHLAAAIETKSGFDFQTRLMRRDGTGRDVISKAVCEIDDRGEVVAVFGVFQDITHHTRALDAVRRSESRYRLLADHMGDAVTRIALDGSSRYISPAIEGLLGYRPEEMAGQTAQAFVYPEDQPLILAAFGELANGLDRTTLQHRAVRKDGSVIWVETGFQLVRDADGTPLEIVAVIRDNAERRAMEAALIQVGDLAREQARRASMAERIAGLGHWRLDVVSHGIVWSDEMYKIYGLPPGQPLDFGALMAMTHPEDRATTEAQLRIAVETGEPFDQLVTRIMRRDGQERHLASNTFVEKDQDGVVKTVIGTLMDVTEQRLAEIARAESEARYRLLAENGGDMLMHCDLAGLLTYISPGVLTTTGFSPDELIGRRAVALIHPDDAAIVGAAVAAQFQGRGAAAPTSIEYRARHKDGHHVWLEAKPTLAIDPATGQMTGITDVVRDITARKQLETDLRAAQSEAETAAAVKGEFLANMSHELRTPLTTILGFSRLAAEQAELSDETRRFMDRISNAGKTLLLTVNDILDFSKLEAGQVEIHRQPVCVEDLARSTLELFSDQAASKAIDLQIDGVGQLPAKLEVDPDRVRQILLNLVGNAIKFTDQGSVRLAAAYDGPRQTLTFSIIDTGQGIGAGQAERLFQRFSQVDGSPTRKHGGTGLGLAICKGLVEAMSGEIGVTSRLGEGATFWFALPAAVGESNMAAGDRRDDSAGLLQGCRVLVVGDNAARNALIRRALSPSAAGVTEVADGSQALGHLDTAPFDLILVALDRDARVVAKRLGDQPGLNDNVPVLVIAEDAGAPREEPNDRVISGPLTAASLVAGMVKALHWTARDQVDDAA